MRRGAEQVLTATSMEITRRDFLWTAVVAVATSVEAPMMGTEQTRKMYGLIGKMIAVAGQGDALIAILLASVGNMPGCLSYVVARDATDADGIWITEVWDSKESHEASLKLPAVREAISRGRPLIAKFDQGFVTTPVGGYGLPKQEG
jgi:quinol monooxygenase YgiN